MNKISSSQIVTDETSKCWGHSLTTTPAQDMHSLYNALQDYTSENGKPRVLPIVVNELPDEVAIQHYRAAQGFDLLFIKRDLEKKMETCAFAAIDQNTPQPWESVETEKLDGNKVGHLLTMLICSAEFLHINCPQVEFMVDTSLASDYVCDENGDISLIHLNPNMDMVYAAARVMRHAWQRKYCSSMYAHHLPFALLDALCRASHAESSHTIFESQIAEFDASTFAYWMMKMAYGTVQYPEHTPLIDAIATAADALANCWQQTKNHLMIPDYRKIYPALII